MPQDRIRVWRGCGASQMLTLFFFSSRRRHTRSLRDWSSDVCSSDLATVIASADYAKAHGLKPLGRLVSWAVVGVEPKYMGIGPAPAARKALQKAGMKLEQLDLIEVNEAFAPQYLAVEKELGLDRAKTNVDGGAIAIGHPLAATGARITIHLLHALRRHKQRFGLGSACIGGGQGPAAIVEAFPAGGGAAM